MNANNRNGLIDGWRGISVLCVVIGHYLSYQFPPTGVRPFQAIVHSGDWLEVVKNLLYRMVVPIGETGVLFFFVISGYLITKLLVSEEERNGRVSLGAFYIRRFFRIMPPFYVYLLTLLVLRSFGFIYLQNDAFVRSAAYVCNLSTFKCSWWLGHTWSLSVEEQFYVGWPLIFIWVGFCRRPMVAVISLIILAVASYFFL